VEADGYDGVASMENKHDPFLALAIAGTVTERIELHTSVAIAFARSPMAVANVGWDLSGATGGRFVVGLGSQVRAHNERRFSVPWTPPACANMCRRCARSGAAGKPVRSSTTKAGTIASP
jgi:alkanesulfonate monooxygenase SsuD/methylene tetrahydromethanopterin reductase-like flavin-dependent oxidoreductase (luciferase family)